LNQIPYDSISSGAEDGTEAVNENAQEVLDATVAPKKKQKKACRMGEGLRTWIRSWGGCRARCLESFWCCFAKNKVDVCDVIDARNEACGITKDSLYSISIRTLPTYNAIYRGYNSIYKW